MLRLIAALLILAVSATAEPLPLAPPLIPAPGFMLMGPAKARGALVWLHGAYDLAQFSDPPPVQDWAARLAGRGYDVWRLNRIPRQDPIAEGGDKLLAGLRGIRAAGYRRVIVAGFSRGGFIGLAALAHPDLADAVAAISPAAHGPRPERRAEALAAFEAMMDRAQTSRFALVQLNDDALDPNPELRAGTARVMAARTHSALLQIFRPMVPRGHMGSDEPEFDALFGGCLADFLDGLVGPDACGPAAGALTTTSLHPPSSPQ